MNLKTMKAAIKKYWKAKKATKAMKAMKAKKDAKAKTDAEAKKTDASHESHEGTKAMKDAEAKKTDASLALGPVPDTEDRTGTRLIIDLTQGAQASGSEGHEGQTMPSCNSQATPNGTLDDDDDDDASEWTDDVMAREYEEESWELDGYESWRV